MSIDKDKKIEIQQKMLERLSARISEMGNELDNCRIENAKIAQEYQEAIAQVEAIKTEYEQLIQELKQEKVLLDIQKERFGDLLKRFKGVIETTM